MKADPWLLVPEGSLREGWEILLDNEEARHASGALRLKAGNRVVLSDGAGSIGVAGLTVCGRSGVVAVVDQPLIRVSPLPGPTVALGVLHTKAMDWAVQKAVEVGVETFVPLLCDRSQGSRDRAAERLEHWRRVSHQALKQCRRAWMMRVEKPLEMEAVVEGRLAPGVVADPEGPAALSGSRSRWETLLVGPEGGLTVEERKGLVRAGWSTLALGSHVLRAETAAVVGAALLTLRMNEEEMAENPTSEG